MKIDFSSLAGGASLESILDPRKLFAALPNKQSKFKYLRDVQSDVLDKWFPARAKVDLLVKMNTGGGKTVVGLLLLKSSMNENVGPSAYITPDNYLAKQVTLEAKALGLETTDDPRSSVFAQSRAILITNIDKLFNGQSVFGVVPEPIKIPIGTVLIDDAHACLQKVEDQFTLTIRRSDPAQKEVYDQLMTLFKDDLCHQSESGVNEILSGDHRRILLVPYWCWQDKHPAVVKMLAQASSLFKFSWPLIKEHLRLCRCAVGAEAIEIAPRCLPTHVVRSFRAAQRRIFLTATLAHDSVLVTHFGADNQSLKEPITPQRVDDIGDRLILIPQQINPLIGDDDIKTFLKAESKHHNVVVIAPSNERAKAWQPYADSILDKDSIYAGVEKLRNGHCGLVVLVNKYDGIDLADDACRILVIDDIPRARRLTDQFEDSLDDGGDELIGRRIQRIEQGMGRGVRANDDYCVVILMGARLVESINHPRAMSKFTPATVAQLKLASGIADQVKDATLDDLKGVIDYCLNRDQQWLLKSRGVLLNLSNPVDATISSAAINRRAAFDSAEIGNVVRATEILQNEINQTSDNQLKGLLLQELAEYKHHFNPADAAKIQVSAISHNRCLLRRPEGSHFVRLTPVQMSQSEAARTYLCARYPSVKDCIIGLNSILSDLKFLPDTSEEFERAVMLLGEHLGFSTQRPEQETGKGPDVLWCVGGLQFFVIECKNGAITNFIAKKDLDQLSGSVHWFQDQYDKTCQHEPMIIHPHRQAGEQGSPHPSMRVMTQGCLSQLTKQIMTFERYLDSKGIIPDAKELAEQFKSMNLTPSQFLKTFTKPWVS